MPAGEFVSPTDMHPTAAPATAAPLRKQAACNIPSRSRFQLAFRFVTLGGAAAAIAVKHFAGQNPRGFFPLTAGAGEAVTFANVLGFGL